jgi:hypothetical protein
VKPVLEYRFLSTRINRPIAFRTCLAPYMLLYERSRCWATRASIAIGTSAGSRLRPRRPTLSLSCTWKVPSRQWHKFVPDKERLELRRLLVPGKDAQEQRPGFMPGKEHQERWHSFLPGKGAKKERHYFVSGKDAQERGVTGVEVSGLLLLRVLCSKVCRSSLRYWETQSGQRPRFVPDKAQQEQRHRSVPDKSAQ